MHSNGYIVRRYRHLCTSYSGMLLRQTWKYAHMPCLSQPPYIRHLPQLLEPPSAVSSYSYRASASREIVGAYAQYHLHPETRRDWDLVGSRTVDALASTLQRSPSFDLFHAAQAVSGFCTKALLERELRGIGKCLIIAEVVNCGCQRVC